MSETQSTARERRVERADVARAARRDAYFYIVVIATVILGFGASILTNVVINNRSLQREREAREGSQRAFCAIIILLDDSYRAVPPATPSGKQLAAAIASARVTDGCPPPKE